MPNNYTFINLFSSFPLFFPDVFIFPDNFGVLGLFQVFQASGHPENDCQQGG